MLVDQNEIKITRFFDAPVALVWEAWNDPAQAAKWWGPRGFTITHHSKELRVGGHWHYTMHGPDGVDYPNKTVYLEVEHGKKLVYDHGANDDQPALFRVTVTFEAVANKTKMSMSMAVKDSEQAKQMAHFIKSANGNSTWDRLAEYIIEKQTQSQTFVINRYFKTSIQQLFAMWTDPQHFGKWMGPAGSQLEFFESDVREGKTTFYKMQAGPNVVMYGKVQYIKIQSPHYLEYIQMFADQNGQISRHPMAPIWPEYMRTKVELTEINKETTLLKLTWQPTDKATAEEILAFVNAKDGMTMGWTGSFDKLEGYLTDLK